jgi:hypothetical protein
MCFSSAHLRLRMASFNVLGATYSNGGGSATQFYDTSTAGDAILTAQAGTVRGADGGQIYFKRKVHSWKCRHDRRGRLN